MKAKFNLNLQKTTLIFFNLILLFLLCLLLYIAIGNIRNFKEVKFSAPNILKSRFAQIYIFSEFYTLHNKGIKDYKIIFIPDRKSKFEKSNFLKINFVGRGIRIAQIIFVPTLIKFKKYNYQLSTQEFIYLKKNIKASQIFKNNRIFNHVSISGNWKRKLNWAVFEYAEGKKSYIFLLPINWRNNITLKR